jgi:hypothetical protein
VNPSGNYVDPAGGAATVDDILQVLNPQQEHMLLYAMKEVYSHLDKTDPQQAEALIDALARENNGKLLDEL